MLLTEGTPVLGGEASLFPAAFRGSDPVVRLLIDLIARREGGRQQRSFTGLEDPPVLQSVSRPHLPAEGQPDRLDQPRLAGLLRDLTVGEVLGLGSRQLAESVTIHAFVRAPFDQYVHANSRFWNASGISVRSAPRP